MKRSKTSFADLVRKRRLGFTLIEILVVMTIIGILMALVIGVAGPVQQQARVYRARGEIAGFETALTRFETDNGFVPNSTTIGTNASGAIYEGDPASSNYMKAARALFLAITGRQWYQSTKDPGVNYFTSLKEGQVRLMLPNADQQNAVNAPSGNYDTYTNASSFTNGDYLKDPWGQPYGYYYNAADATNHSLFNQVTYDLWSTSGEYSNAAATSPTVKRWTANWPNQ